MPNAVAEFIEIGNYVDCLWQEPGAQPFEFPAQILEINNTYTHARVQSTHDSQIVVVPIANILRATVDAAAGDNSSWGQDPDETNGLDDGSSEFATDNSGGFGVEAAGVDDDETGFFEPEIGDETGLFEPQNQGVSIGAAVSVWSQQYNDYFPAKVLAISPDQTKLKVQWDDGNEIEVVPLEYATLIEAPPMAKTAMQVAPVAKVGKAPAAKGKVAATPAIAASSGFVAGQKVKAFSPEYNDHFDATINELNADGSKAKVAWADGSGVAVVTIDQLKRKPGRQPGAVVGKAAAAAPAVANAGKGRGKGKVAAAPAGAVEATTSEGVTPAQAAHTALMQCRKGADLSELKSLLSDAHRGKLIAALT